MARIENIAKRGRFIYLELVNFEKVKIHYEVYLKHSLYRGDEISEEKIKSILDEEELYSAKETALRLLGRRIHSEHDLRLKLSKREFPKNIIDEVIRYLIDRDFINDFQFAERFIDENFFRKKAGLNKIINGLRKKGIKRDIIEKLTGSLSETETVFENAKILADKKLSLLKKKGKDDKIRMRHKVYSHLLSKGYSFDTARQIVDQLRFENDDSII